MLCYVLVRFRQHKLLVYTQYIVEMLKEKHFTLATGLEFSPAEKDDCSVSDLSLSFHIRQITHRSFCSHVHSYLW